MTTDRLALKFFRKRFGAPTFGSFLRAARTMRDMSQVEMAKFLGISKSSLCDIEKNRQIVSAELAAKFARKCQLSELMAVELALKQMLKRSGLKYDIKLKAA